MPAGSTYTPIATTTLGSAVTSYTFSSIPQIYTDLVLVMSVKNTGSNNNGQFRFNGDNNTNYSGNYVTGNGASTGVARLNNATIMYTPDIATANFTPIVINIMNYSNTTTFKTALVRGGDGNINTQLWAQMWRSTAAINQIDILTFGGNLAVGSTFTLYGIAAA